MKVIHVYGILYMRKYWLLYLHIKVSFLKPLENSFELSLKLN
jgi:hypothetical protein